MTSPTSTSPRSYDGALMAALVAGATLADAAASAGVSARTARRRAADPAFAAELASARGELVAQTTRRLTAAAVQATDALVALLGSASETVRLRAASKLLDLEPRRRESEELEARLAALEQQLMDEPK